MYERIKSGTIIICFRCRVYLCRNDFRRYCI
ncbi:TPA: hypothetical protein I8W54_002783 [Morganella morganii]|nr:hypothetical protein [Morganella morganii]HAT1525107.1 hypothetical protein [Morganella morganii]